MLLSQDKASARVTATAFPADTKVRVSFTGLAYAELDPAKSTFHVLRHVGHHALSMRVIGTRRTSGVTVCNVMFYIAKTHGVEVMAENAIMPPSVETAGTLPLDTMINLTDLHNQTLIEDVPAGLDPPSAINVYRCAFYAMDYISADQLFFIENSSGATQFSRDVGNLMGGNICCTSANSRVSLISPSIPLPGGRLDLPIEDGGEEVVYDVQFNNECTDLDECKKDIAATSGEDGTDFRFYYDILKDSKNPGRRFDLMQGFGTMGVSACNPIIIKPHQPY